MQTIPVHRILLTFALLCTLNAGAQKSKQPPADPDAPSLLSEVPSVPGLAARLRGLNAGITVLGVHDSSAGWYTLFIPAASFSFARRFSVDASMPVYFYRLAETTVTTTTTNPGPGGPGQPGQPTQTTTTTTLQPRTWDPGDGVLAVHGNFAVSRLQDVITTSMTLPSGDSDSGLSTGRVTFDFDNHAQINVSRAGLLLDLGVGDSSNLVNRLVTKDYTSLGPLAHFQTGVLVPLLGRSSFQAVAYEQLPIGDNKLYTTLKRPGYPDRTVVSGRSVSEDNGFTNSLSVPLSSHLTLQGYYNRSLRLHLDTAAASLTWVWRGYRRPATQSLVSGSLLQK